MELDAAGLDHLMDAGEQLLLPQDLHLAPQCIEPNVS